MRNPLCCDYMDGVAAKMKHPEPPPDCRFFVFQDGEWYFVYRTPAKGTGIWDEPGCKHFHQLTEISGDMRELARGAAIAAWLTIHYVRNRKYLRYRYKCLPDTKNSHVLELKTEAKRASVIIDEWQLWPVRN